MTPAYRIEIDGKDFTDLWGKRLTSLSITDEAGIKSDTLEVEFDGRDKIRAPKIGAKVRVWLGYAPAPVLRGQFIIDEWNLSGPLRTLRVSAKAAELTSRIRAAKTRAFDGKALGAIVNQIAADHGLTAQVDSELASIQIAHIDQANESDLGFLSRLAKRNGGTFKLSDGKVMMAKKGGANLPSGTAKTAIALTPDMVGSWSFTQGKRGEYKTVSASYMDHAKGKRVSVKAGSGEPKHRIRTLYGSKAEAEAAVKAELGAYTRGQGTFEVSGPGIPTMFAEASVTAAGFDQDVDGGYLVKSVRHTLEGGGYSTDISMEAKAT